MRFLSFLCFLLLSLPGFTQEDDERIIREAEVVREKQMQMAAKIEHQTQQITDQKVFDLQKIKEQSESQVKEFNLMIKEDREEFKKLIQQNIFANFPPDMVRAIILGKVKGQPWEKIFETFPKLLDIVVDLTRDKEAMLGIVGILDRSDDMNLFGFICIGIAILALIFKKLFISDGKTWASRLATRIVFNLGILSMSLGAFYILFEQEVSPILKVFGRHF